MTDLLAIKDQVSQQQSNKNEGTSSIVNEIKATTGLPSSEITKPTATTTTKSLEIESEAITTSSTFEETIAEVSTEIVSPSTNSNAFVTSTPASETITLETIQENEILSYSLKNQPQTNENNENTTVDPNTRTKKISIDSIDQEDYTFNIIFPKYY